MTLADWYPEDEYTRYELFERIRTDYGFRLPLSESCETAGGFFDWLELHPRSR